MIWIMVHPQSSFLKNLSTWLCDESTKSVKEHLCLAGYLNLHWLTSWLSDDWLFDKITLSYSWILLNLHPRGNIYGVPKETVPVDYVWNTITHYLLKTRPNYIIGGIKQRINSYAINVQPRHFTPDNSSSCCSCVHLRGKILVYGCTCTSEICL